MSANDTTNIWAWVMADAERLEREGGQRAAIAEQWERFEHFHHNDYAAADHAITLALDAAIATDELRWQLFLRHWRLQLWLGDDVARALPEAIDLLHLATDERLRDVPQRICAFHDVVDCYARMDPSGYHDEIVANSEDVLAQLPKRHTCADCARLHLASAAGASGRAGEAQAHLAQFAANAYNANWAGNTSSQGDVYEMIAQWDDAERAFRRTMELARGHNLGEYYLEGLLGTARALAGKGDLAGAVAHLSDARHTAKYTGGTYLLARLLEVEGYVAAAAEERGPAVAYLTQAAQQYLTLGRYRQAALSALHAAELEHTAGQSEGAQSEGAHTDTGADALDIAARAVGAMPPASRDVRDRLAALGRNPLLPAAADAPLTAQRDGDSAAPASATALAERRALEEALALHIAHGHAGAAATALFRLGRWHLERDEMRAAVDYLIMNAALERLLRLTMNDREDALGALSKLRERLPPGTVDNALTSAEAGPPATIQPLVASIAPAHWRWTIRAVAAEVGGRPAIEPESEDADEDNGFHAWLDHVASMTALILRFHDRLTRDQIERWTHPLDRMAEEIEPQLGPDRKGHEVLTFARGMAALARGDSAEDVLRSVAPPFNQVVEQAIEIARMPIWRHPGCSPLDYFVEQDAQMAVRALRLRDDHRADRLANLALRFDLQAIDLRTEEELAAVARFVAELARLVASGGVAQTTPEPPLEEPFAGVFAAVVAASQTTPHTPSDSRSV